MERCAAPRPESNSPPDPVTSTESAAETGGDADVYECRICGYKVTNVKCLSQHLQAAHPVTSLPDSSSVGNKRCETQTECGGGVGDDGETSSLNGELASHVKEKVSYELLLSSEQLHEFGALGNFRVKGCFSNSFELHMDVDSGIMTTLNYAIQIRVPCIVSAIQARYIKGCQYGLFW